RVGLRVECDTPAHPGALVLHGRLADSWPGKRAAVSPLLSDVFPTSLTEKWISREKSILPNPAERQPQVGPSAVKTDGKSGCEPAYSAHGACAACSEFALRGVTWQLALT